MPKVISLSDRRVSINKNLEETKSASDKIHPFTDEDLFIVLRFFDYVRDLSSSDDSFIEIHGDSISIKIEHNSEADLAGVIDDLAPNQGILLEESFNTYATFFNRVDQETVMNLSEALDAMLIVK